MKLFAMMLLVMVMMGANAQSISLRFGKNLTPSDHVSLRYEHWTNGALNLSLGGFFERSRKNNLNLSVLGAEALAEWAGNREGYAADAFGLRAGAGLSWQVENEPWIYKDWPFKRRSSFGLLGEFGAEWFMTDQFTLRGSLQQKILLNPHLGRYRFLLGLSLAYRLNN